MHRRVVIQYGYVTRKQWTDPSSVDITIRGSKSQRTTEPGTSCPRPSSGHVCPKCVKNGCEKNSLMCTWTVGMLLYIVYAYTALSVVYRQVRGVVHNQNYFSSDAS